MRDSKHVDIRDLVGVINQGGKCKDVDPKSLPMLLLYSLLMLA